MSSPCSKNHDEEPEEPETKRVKVDSEELPKNNDDDDDLYKSAIQALLHSSDHQSVTKEEIEAAARRRQRTVVDMRIYLKRVGLLEQLFFPRIIHVTGTKGKGSTACLCNAILQNYPKQTENQKLPLTVGLFTSPHLIDIRERIRINGKLVSKSVFGQAYWTLRKRLEENQKEEDDNDDDDDAKGLAVLPGYFRMLTLMAMYIFTNYETPMDVVILEVGMGGRYDATNILDMIQNNDNNNNNNANHKKPDPIVACGITLLDYDHCRVLGNTLEEIAWEKGGIFKVLKEPGHPATPHPKEKERNDGDQKKGNENDKRVPANKSNRSFFALDTNTDSALDVLRSCASIEGDGMPLHLVGTKNPKLPSDCTIGLQGSHQRINAELAIALCQAIMNVPEDNTTTTTTNTDTAIMYQALANASWPGRCQTVSLPNDHKILTEAGIILPNGVTPDIRLRLDGAHTIQSIQSGLEWFQSVSSQTNEHDNNTLVTKRMLLFNCSHERDPVELLQLLHQIHFDCVYFCVADSSRPSAVAKKSAYELLKDAGKQVTEENLATTNSTPDETPTWQDTLHTIWLFLDKEKSNGIGNDATASKTLDMGTNMDVITALTRGLQKIYQENNEKTSCEVFVTGSLYLVGSMLSGISWSEPVADGKLKEGALN